MMNTEQGIMNYEVEKFRLRNSEPYDYGFSFSLVRSVNSPGQLKCFSRKLKLTHYILAALSQLNASCLTERLS